MTSTIYEIQYTANKSTTIGITSIDSDCLILANSLREAEDKFNTNFVGNKRGLSYEINAIYKYKQTVIV